jgi:hypothetical protein
MIPMPMNSLSVGPGEPGPEDEWKMPPGALEAQDETVLESEAAVHGAGLLHRLTHRG